MINLHHYRSKISDASLQFLCFLCPSKISCRICRSSSEWSLGSGLGLGTLDGMGWDGMGWVQGQDNKASCTFTRPIQAKTRRMMAPRQRPAIWLYFMRGARLKMQSTSPWMGQTGTCRLGECLTGPKKANGPTTATTAATAQQQHLQRQQQMALKKPSLRGEGKFTASSHFLLVRECCL